MLAFFLAVAVGPAKAPPEIVRLPHEGQRTAVAFSSDSRTLASGGADNQIRLWDVATSKPKLAFRAHSAPAGISRLTYFPGGQLLASASWAGDGTVKIWDEATGKQKQLIGKHEGGIAVLAASPDGKFLAWGEGSKIHLHDVKANRVAQTVVIRVAVDSVAFSPDSTLLATAEGGNMVRFWEVSSGKSAGGVRAGQTTATGSQAVAFSRDGKTVATASGKVKLWDVASGKQVAELGPPDEEAFCVAISGDGRYLAVGTSHALRLWDWASRKEIHSWRAQPSSVAFSPDGKWLAFGSRRVEGMVGLIDLETGK